MLSSSPGEITQLLQALTHGDSTALDKLIPLIDDKLRGLAHSLLLYKYPHQKHPRQDLETTAFINEALLRLIQSPQPKWESRKQFFADASFAMRRILVEHSRARLARKRGGSAEHIRLEDAEQIPDVDSESLQTKQAVDLLALDEALHRLANLDARKSAIVDLRYFGGLTIEEVGEVLWMSPRLVAREWRLARAWLKRELSEVEYRQPEISTTQKAEPDISSIIINEKELAEAWSKRELVATLMSKDWAGLKLLVRLKSIVNLTESKLVSDIELEAEIVHSTLLKLEDLGALEKLGDVFTITKRGRLLVENLEKAIGNRFD